MEEKSLPWKIKTIRNDSCPKLVDYILLAEFDIDTGSTLRIQYPSNLIDPSATNFADYMLPEGVHNREIDYTYIILNRKGKHHDSSCWIVPSINCENIDAPTLLYGVNMVKTKYDNSVRRGAIVKAITIFSQYHFIEILKPLLELALERYFTTPSIEVIQQLFNDLNSVRLSNIPRPNYVEQILMRRRMKSEYINSNPLHDPSITSIWNQPIHLKCFENTNFVLNIPLHCTPDEIGDINVSLLCKIFGESVMKIYHAILTKQRVLFVGYNHSASEIAQIVLSAVALCSPPMLNIIRRVYPYATLSDLTFLEVKGYIAGVTNPMFQQHESWWDVLCILDLPNNTGFVYSSDENTSNSSHNLGGGSGIRNSSHNTSSPNVMSISTKGNAMGNFNATHRININAYEDTLHYSVDNRFIVGVLSGIISSKLSEDWVREQFFDYTSTILRHAQVQNPGEKYSGYSDKIRKFLDCNASRIAIISQSDEFLALPSNPWIWSEIDESSNAVAKTDAIEVSGSETGNLTIIRNDTVDSITSPPTKIKLNSDSTLSTGDQLKGYVLSLQSEFVQNVEEVQNLVHAFHQLEIFLVNEPRIQALLILLPESLGGILPIASGVFHANPSIRLSSYNILKQISMYESTKSCFLRLNRMIAFGYARQEKLNQVDETGTSSLQRSAAIARSNASSAREAVRIRNERHERPRYPISTVNVLDSFAASMNQKRDRTSDLRKSDVDSMPLRRSGSDVASNQNGVVTTSPKADVWSSVVTEETPPNNDKYEQQHVKKVHSSEDEEMDPLSLVALAAPFVAIQQTLGDMIKTGFDELQSLSYNAGDLQNTDRGSFNRSGSSDRSRRHSRDSSNDPHAMKETLG